MPRESEFQSELIQELREKFPGCIILKNDPNYLQGFPDLLILYEDKWAVLESKSQIDSKRRPNQEYYITRTREMSYGNFVYPENKEHVIRELQQAFRPGRRTRFPKRL